MKLSNSCQTIKRQIRQKTPEYLFSSKKKPIFFINMLKNKKIISDNIKSMRSRNEFKKKNIQFLTVKIKSKNLNISSRNSKNNALPKICPYTYKYFYKEENKHPLHKSGFSVNSIDNSKNNMESNFMQLCEKSNIYTSNVKYISNKKMILLDRYKFDNNIYKPDRLKLHDMSIIPRTKIKLKKIIYKKILLDCNRVCNNNNIELEKKGSDL
jgi:hypothetical protein